MPTIQWRGIDGSLEDAVITDGRAQSVVTTNETVHRYTATWTHDWVTRSLTIGTGFRLESTSDGWNLNGRWRPELAPAVDVDLVLTPLTNTLAIQRLALAVGSSAEIITAWVDVPSFEVHPDPQRYTRTGVNTYLFESLDSDFRAEITVDESGFVVDYPGLFTMR